MYAVVFNWNYRRQIRHNQQYLVYEFQQVSRNLYIVLLVQHKYDEKEGMTTKYIHYKLLKKISLIRKSQIFPFFNL